MTAFLKRIAFALGLQKREEPEPFDFDAAHVVLPVKRYDELVEAASAYLSDFGPNVTVEDLGGKPVFYEDGQPVYPGREKAP